MKKYVSPCLSLLTKKCEFGHVGGVSKAYFTWFPVKSLLHEDAGECCPLRGQERGETPGVSGTGIELPGWPPVLGHLGEVLRSISASGTSRQPGHQWELAGLVRGCSVSRGTARIQTSVCWLPSLSVTVALMCVTFVGRGGSDDLKSKIPGKYLVFLL